MGCILQARHLPNGNPLLLQPFTQARLSLCSTSTMLDNIAAWLAKLLICMFK
jgi:hypothetical protein